MRPADAFWIRTRCHEGLYEQNQYYRKKVNSEMVELFFDAFCEF